MPNFADHAVGSGESDSFSVCGGCATAILQVVVGLIIIVIQSIIHGRYAGEFETLKEFTHPFVGFVFGALFLITGAVGMVSASKNKAAILLFMVLNVLSMIAGLGGIGYFAYITSLTKRTISVLSDQYGCSANCADNLQAVLDGYGVVYSLQIVTSVMCAVAVVVASVGTYFSFKGLCDGSTAFRTGNYSSPAVPVNKTITKSSNFGYDDYPATNHHGTASRDYGHDSRDFGRDSRDYGKDYSNDYSKNTQNKSYEEWL